MKKTGFIPAGSLFLSLVLFAALLTGCAAPSYTTDDGSPVDEKLLSTIKLYGKGEQAIRPQIVKSAQLKDEDCSKQYDLPFAVATSHKLEHMQKIAWVRGLQVDERLTVISADESTGLKPGDKIEKIDGDDDDADELLEELAELKEDGDEFDITLSDGRTIHIKPVEVCRGLVEISTPDMPEAQDFHWLKSTHPMSVFNHDLTPDEALWMVLWTQGLSEEAGARMKTFHYGLKIVKTGLTVASIASGVGAAAGAAQAAAANIATQEATKAAAAAAGKEVAKYAAQQVADEIRKKMLEAAIKEAGKAAAQEMAVAAISSAGLFKSSLSGVSWVAGTGFWMADKWALDRMARLGADPLAAYTLHQKLASVGQADNAFVFDEERVANMNRYAQDGGFAAKATYALTGTIAEGEAQIAVSSGVEVRALGASPPSEVLAPAATEATVLASESLVAPTTAHAAPVATVAAADPPSASMPMEPPAIDEPAEK
ncbi:MAG: hypothetical protein ACO1NO_05785 [Burkholderiaceae bacterium]